METIMGKSLWRSLRAALRGLNNALWSEPAFKYLVAAAIAVFGAILYFGTSRAESAVLIIVAFAVLTLEVINTLFERVLDIMRPEDDERVRRIKDLMAGLVLLASIGAAAIGLVVLLPYFRALFGI